MMGRDSSFIESTRSLRYEPEEDTTVDFGEEGLVAPNFYKVDFEWEKSPEFQKEFKRYQNRNKIALRLTKWMMHIPVVGYYVATFWYLLIAEGFYQTLTPRYGGITFSFLNDGCGATVWHTWRSVVDHHGNFSGIYTMGAPKNRKQAEEWEAKWEAERKEKRGGI